MPKRTLDEWLTVARVSKNVGHFFLEGPTDARLLTHLSGYPPNVDFRSASEIELNFEDSEVSSLWGGCKLILLKLASRASHQNLENIRCFVDADFSPLVNHLYSRENLFETEFANLPAATLTFEWLKGFLLKGYGLVLTNEIWFFLINTLTFAFYCRYISACSNQPSPAPEISKFVVRKKDHFLFDSSSYLSQYFRIKPSLAQDEADKVVDILTWSNFETRKQVNSNDIFDMLYYFLRNGGKIAGSTPKDSIRNAYFAAFDDSIYSQSGFKPVVVWIQKFNPT